MAYLSSSFETLVLLQRFHTCASCEHDLTFGDRTEWNLTKSLMDLIHSKSYATQSRHELIPLIHCRIIQIPERKHQNNKNTPSVSLAKLMALESRKDS